METKNVMEKLLGNGFAVTSVGVAMNAGDGVFKAYDPETKQIKQSRTIMPIKGSFAKIQTVDVVEGDFIEIGGAFMQVVIAGESSLGVVNPLTGEQKTITKEINPDGIAFVTVVRSTLDKRIITKLVNGKLSDMQLALVSGEMSLDEALAQSMVAESDELSASELAMFIQATK